jgi:hypothetical protein
MIPVIVSGLTLLRNRGNIINVMMIIPTTTDDTIPGIIRVDFTKKMEETLLMS